MRKFSWSRPAPEPERPEIDPLCARPTPWLRGWDRISPRPMTIGCSNCNGTHELTSCMNAFTERVERALKELGK